MRRVYVKGPKGELVPAIDMGERAQVDGVEAGEVVLQEGLRLSAGEVGGTFAWVPVADMRLIQ